MLSVAILAIVTGSVLLLGYALATAAFLLILTLMVRRLVRRHLSRAGGRARTLSLASHREPKEHDHPRAA
jgi:hypothetical protein